jgi:hypothetical protein
MTDLNGIALFKDIVVDLYQVEVQSPDKKHNHIYKKINMVENLIHRKNMEF